ncbi:MAG: hypothetical protein KDB25_04550 [Leucobacter sp.]|nr:hypothetical protein [Leucobacter sp.]
MAKEKRTSKRAASKKSQGQPEAEPTPGSDEQAPESASAPKAERAGKRAEKRAGKRAEGQQARKAKRQAGVGGTPRVDLLPAKQRADRLHDRIMQRLLVGVFVSAILAGVIWAVGFIPVANAELRLSQADAETGELAIELQRLSDVQKSLDDLNGLKRIREALINREVLFSDLRDQLTTEMPADVELARFAGQMLDSPVRLEGEGDIDTSTVCLAETAVLHVTTSSERLLPVSEFTNLASELPGFQCMIVAGTAMVDGQRLVDLHIGLGSGALSGRFAEEEESE